MKAIIITFNGEYKSPASEEAFVNHIVESLDLARKEGTNIQVKIQTLDDKETAALLLQKVMESVSEPTPTPTKADIIRKFCKTIIQKIGSPALMDRNTLNQELIKFLINSNKNEVKLPLSIIIEITSEAKYLAYVRILNEYGLKVLPTLVKDLNPVFKFV